MNIKNKSKGQAQLESNIENGIQNQLISFNKDKTRITYHVKEPYVTSFTNPEEQVRAACFCELVLKYKYPAEQIQFEVYTKPDKDRIDLLVYKDKEFKEPFVVVECKKDGISDAEFEMAREQAYRYANYKRSWYMMIIAGNTVQYFNMKDYKSGEREKNIISDLPRGFGKPPKYKYYKQKGKDLNIVSREELIKALGKCHDTVWQGGKLAPTTAFDEISKLLFCKLKDEKSTRKNDPYQFQIGTNESAEVVFQRIDAIYQKAKQEDEEVFKENIYLSSEVVFSCLKHLQKLAINNIDLDSKGLAFEKFMQDFFKGKMGQFFTPRNVVSFAVAMMQPDNSMYVLDPACGSGGFLLNAMEYVKKYAEKNYTHPLEIYRHWHDFAKDRLFGIEINNQIARVCKMNMILHDDGHSNIINADSLEDIPLIQLLGKKFKKNYFDLILTNPPFGARVKGGEKEYLQKYKLGKNKSKVHKSQKTEILFIERCREFLKPGTGKMTIIVPNGILNNSSLQYVRDYIMENNQILAVVSLPQFTFSHYGAGVRTSVLFLRKKAQNKILGNYPIFMAIADQIGYDATGRETSEKNDFPQIIEQYRKFEQIQHVKVSSDLENKIFLIHRDEIEGRMDSYYYKPEFIKNRFKVENSNIPHKQLGKLMNFSNETWNQKDYFTNKFFYIEIGGIDIKTGDINKISEINISEAPSSAKMVVRENDILISTTRPNRGAISLIDKSFDGFIASTGFAILRKVKHEINRNYLFYALRFESTLKQFEQRCSGGIYPTITKDELRKVLIPLPPKETQLRIVALMDRAYALKKEKEVEADQVVAKAKQEIEDLLLETENL